MPTPIPFADDGNTRAYHANLQTWRTPPAPRLSIWRFLFASAALPLPLVFLAAASWLAWTCFQGDIGTLDAVVLTLTGIAASAAFIRWHRGMDLGAALTLVALVGLAGLGWIVIARVALALVTGG